MLPDGDLHDVDDSPLALVEGPIDSIRHTGQEQR